jgi:Cu2+-exporting ATPase
MLADDLIGLPDLFTTARRAVALYKQNFAIAFAYNAVAIPFAVAGFATPLMAAIAMSTSSIAVLLNASRARAAS